MNYYDIVFSFEISCRPMQYTILPEFLAFVGFIESSRRTNPSHGQLSSRVLKRRDT